MTALIDPKPARETRQEKQPKGPHAAKPAEHSDAKLRPSLQQGQRPAAWWQEFLQPWAQGVWKLAAPVWRPIRGVLVCVTPVGWTVLVLGLVGWGLAHWLGWQEFAVVAAACLAFFGVGVLFTVGRMRLTVNLQVTPQRVTVGQPSMARFEITNAARGTMLALGVELPVGVSAARYTTTALRPGASYADWVTIPTSQRGVIRVGPVLTQRGDPFGMVRRQLAWTTPVDLFVHPQVTAIDALGTGLLRDLEGQTTQDMSASDLAFHALRDYIPGDDQRYIHWRSSARVSAIAGEQKFLVRQFLDTRRSHVVIVADVDASVYSAPDEFELALSCGASVAKRAIADNMDLSIVCGPHKQSYPAPYAALDTFSRAAFDEVTLADGVRRIDDIVGEASLLIVVTGQDAPFGELQRARSLVSMQVRMVVIRVSLGTSISLRETSGFTEVRVGTLDDLAKALRGGVAT